MADLNEGILRGEEVIESGGQIMEARKRVVITVAQGGSTSRAVLNALSSSQVPQDGASYDGSAGGGGAGDVRLVRRNAIPLGVPKNNRVQVQIDLFYKWLPPAAIVGSSASGTVSAKTTKDKDGNDMTLTFDGETYTLESKKPTPTNSITIEVYNVAKPLAFTSLYVGKVNSEFWNGGASRTWFCSGVEYEKITAKNRSERQDAVRHYIFHFDWRSDQWDEEQAFFDSSIGRIPDGLTASARKKFKVLEEAAFRNLIDI